MSLFQTFDAFLIAVLQQFGVGNFAGLAKDLLSVGGIVEAAFDAVEIAHQKYFQSIGIFLHEGARDAGAGADDFQSFFIEIDDDRKTFAARHFGLRRGDDHTVGIAD